MTPADPATVRVAAIDCGTNSIRLLVADLDRVGSGQEERDRRLRIVRLGEGVDASGRLTPAAIARVLDACAEYTTVIGSLRAERVRFCATSAARDAADTTELAAGVRRVLGVELEVISGETEAALTAAGAVRGIAGLPHAQCSDLAVPGPHVVVDIGGGSTELVSAPGGPAGVSVPLGSVRLTERLLPGLRPRAEEVAAVRAEVETALIATGARIWDQAASLVGVGGTITTVAAHALNLDAYDAGRIHRAQVPLDGVLASCDALAHASADECRAMPFMHPGRADVIGAGALVLEGVLRRFPRRAYGWLVVSEHDILDGIAWSLVDRER